MKHKQTVRAMAAFLLIVILIACTKQEDTEKDNHTLWYTYPATYWNSQALHLGNSYFGASFLGGIEEEQIFLTEKSIWLGAPANGDWESVGVNPRAKKAINGIRAAVKSWNAQHADSLISNDVFGSAEKFGSFSSIGNLNIRFPGQENATTYKRSLDLMQSIGFVEYTSYNKNFTREYFCSYPDQLMAMKFTGNEKNGISLAISMDVIQDSSAVTITDNTYQLTGSIDGNQRPFIVLINFRLDGGSLSKNKDTLIIKNANEVEAYLTIATDYEMKYPTYRGEAPDARVNAIMAKALSYSYDELKERHIQDYQELYNRVSLELGGGNDAAQLPTSERFERLKSGQPDPGYKELAFNLGRYLIISSSRPNTLPANLQGVWNAFRIAPWSGNYQSNINLQEIYWSCGPTNLSECHEPYLDWISDLTISGKIIADKVYGTNGWVSHTTGNIWGHAAPIGDHPWGMYPVGAAWHCQHMWDHYLFTGDIDYLAEQAYPVLKEASVFWLENLFPYKGYLITAPTVSAEHGALMTSEGLNPAFHDLQSDKYHYSLPGVYQDIQMIWDLFTNTAEAAKLVGSDSFADSLLVVREKLLPLKIGKYGQLQEWDLDIDHPDCHHRHIAHLYAVCPGTQIHPLTTPKLAEASKKSLNMRGDGRYLEQELASGGNWSRAHRMWCWTRLLDGDRANKILTETLTEQGFENVLTYQHAEYHWERRDFFMEDSLYCHFQLDASASIPGCITEMLLQSHMNEIHLLPALPEEFKTGKISGIKARGGFTIDLEWEDYELAKATIYRENDNPVPPIRIKEEIVDPDKSEIITIL